MPITKSAKKAHRASLRKHAFNLARKEALKSGVKEVKKIAASGKSEEAKKVLSLAYKAIDKALKSGVIKKNTAARKKSRLAKLIQNKSH